jgi:hypothetical protein
MVGAPQASLPSGNVFPKPPWSQFIRRGPPFLLPPPGTMAGASQASFQFLKYAYYQFMRKGLPFLCLLQEKCVEYLGFIFQPGISLAQPILHSQWEMSIDWVVSPVIFPQELDVPHRIPLSKWKWGFCRSIPPWNDPATEL